MDAFLPQWHWDQGVKEFVKYTSVQSFIIERICGTVNYLQHDFIVNGGEPELCQLICKSWQNNSLGTVEDKKIYTYLGLISLFTFHFISNPLCINTAMLCTNFKKDLLTKMDVRGEWDINRF